MVNMRGSIHSNTNRPGNVQAEVVISGPSPQPLMEQVSEMHGHPKGEGYGRGCRRVRAPARERDQDHAEED